MSKKNKSIKTVEMEVLRKYVIISVKVNSPKNLFIFRTKKLYKSRKSDVVCKLNFCVLSFRPRRDFLERTFSIVLKIYIWWRYEGA